MILTESRKLKATSWLKIFTCSGRLLYAFTLEVFPIILVLLPISLQAQAPVLPPDVIEQQLEAITENNADAETEDDSFLQALRQFQKNPVNLNTVDIVTLKELAIFSSFQVQQFLLYRTLLGDLISIYELQAIPGFDLAFIERIRPYFTVSTPQNLITSIVDRLRGGYHTLLMRVTRVLEEQKGYKPAPVTTENYYLGSPQKLLFRYKYQFKNLLQFGIIGEKDAGEQFFKGAQKTGFDFYSAHLFARNIGIIKLIALGDFTINLGQGLTQWQSLAFKKGADVTNIKRQLAVLRPYNSAGEINFHRGGAITIAKSKMEATAFVSFKKVDANFIEDTIQNEAYISSLQTSGLHRTAGEIKDKGSQQQFAAGGNIAYYSNRFHIGLNGVQYAFTTPITKSTEPYNNYAISGTSMGNYSIDYSYTFRNIHLFGETAITNRINKASVNGFIISVDSKIDMSVLYRSISKSYQSLYTNAFTESAYPNNESGLFTGISIRPNSFWRLDAYTDFYKSAWLKYLVDAPSTGTDYLVQVYYKPNKRLDMYLRYHTESKVENYNPNDLVLSPVVSKPRQNVRSHITYKLNNSITLRNRVEMVWYDKRGEGRQEGFLTYVDCILKPLMKRYSIIARLQYFETEGYDSRLYAYENDVLFSYSIPVFYDKGIRYYLNLNYDAGKKLSVWFRWAQTVYDGKTTIGTGLDEIEGNKRTEVKLQVFYHF